VDLRTRRRVRRRRCRRSAGSIKAVLCARCSSPRLIERRKAGLERRKARVEAGYSALSLMAPGEGVLTTEFKVNLLAPGSGEAVVARAHVVKAGRTLTVSLAEVFVLQGGRSCCS